MSWFATGLDGSRRFARMMALTVVTISLAVIAGWIGNVAWLTSFRAELTPMTPITSVVSLACGAALVMVDASSFVHRRRFAAICASIAVVIGGLSTLGYWPGWNVGIDTLLIRVSALVSPSPAAGRMAPTSAACSVAIGVALLLVTLDRAPRVAQTLALGVLLVASTSGVGYLYGSSELYQLDAHTPMAIPGAIAFSLLGLGVLAARSDRGWVTSFAGKRSGSVIARQMLPMVVAIPLIVGWLRLQAERLGAIDLALGVALMALTSIATMSIVLVLAAARLNVLDDARYRSAEADALLASVINASDDAIISVAPDHAITSWNPGAEHVYGYTMQETIGQPFSLLVAPGLRADTDSILVNTLIGGHVQRLRAERVTKDGRSITVDATLSPICDAAGTVRAMSEVARDITEQEATEQELRRIEWMLSGESRSADANDLEMAHELGYTGRGVRGGGGGAPRGGGDDDAKDLEMAHELGYGDLVALNRHGVILSSVEPEALASIVSDYSTLLGTSAAVFESNGDYAYGAFTSGWCYLLDSASRALCGTDDDAEALASGKWLCHESCWSNCAKRSIATREPVDIECSGGIHLYAVPVFADGKVVGSINFGYGDPPREPARLHELAETFHVGIEELTAAAAAYDSRPPYIVALARRRLEDSARLIGLLVERKAAVERVEAANKELESFSYSVSHDLRAPLRHISGFVDLLKRDLAERLDERNRHYLDTIADSSAEMGRLIDDLLTFSRMGRTALSPENLSLEGIVKEYIAGLDDDARARDIEWVIGNLPVVQADRAMMRQVFANLLGNAMKYTGPREKPRIEVAARPEGNEIVFYVRDNGVGFDMEYVDKLFGVFQRLHSSAEFEGTGIGLANVRRIITRHGGRTWAEGAVDQGATLFFSLPSVTEDYCMKGQDEEAGR